MITSIFTYSRRGCRTARQVIRLLQGDITCYTVPRLEEPDFLSLEKSHYGEAFSSSDALIFIGACGIAVREIAPYIKDKQTDPAVLCIDELGQFVIPLLSGHIGGANDLARHLAEGLDATAVITTATDINHKFSVDAWAARNNCAISSMETAKAVSAAILEQDIPLFSQFPVLTSLPDGVVPGEQGDLGICLTFRAMEPFSRTLRLIPRILHLGIGCRKGTTSETIRQAVESVLKEHGIDRWALRYAASIDLKREEPGLLQFCENWDLPIRFYTAEELRSVPGDFTPSEFVRSITGVDNVCERAALRDAEKLIVKKTAEDGVTVALAAESWEVRFG